MVGRSKARAKLEHASVLSALSISLSSSFSFSFFSKRADPYTHTHTHSAAAGPGLTLTHLQQLDPAAPKLSQLNSPRELLRSRAYWSRHDGHSGLATRSCACMCARTSTRACLAQLWCV